MNSHFRRFSVGCFGVLLIIFVVYCGWETYVTKYLSSPAYFQRLTKRPVNGLTIEEMSQALIKQLPRGTIEQTIYAFLEQHGIEQDRFQNGQFMRC